MVQFIFDGVEFRGMISPSSSNSWVMGIASRIDWERAMYSASVVERAISVCSLEIQIMRQFAYFITKPVLDMTEDGSSDSSLDQSPAKPAST